MNEKNFGNVDFWDTINFDENKVVPTKYTYHKQIINKKKSN